MNDWNQNGKYDPADKYLDHKLASKGRTSGGSSDGWIWLLLAIVIAVCPPLGAIIVIGIMLFG